MRGAWGYVANGISCVYIIVFIVIFCFPYALPVDALSMNYASLITGGLTIFVGLWWLWRGRRGYKGPKRIQGAEFNRGYRVFHRRQRGISGEREGLDVQERPECSVIALFAVPPIYIYI